MRHYTAEIEAALRECGWWRPSAERPAMPMIANAERAAADWIGWKVGTRGVAANTRENLAHSMRRFFTELRAIAGLKATDPVPVTLLTAANVNAVTARLRERFGQGTVYQTIAAVVDMWGWVADDPEKYAEVPRPPFSKARVLPQRAIYEAPEDVATWAETDACVRRIRRPIPRRLATIMRYTGLRLEQAAHVYREDFDVEHATLLVRKGKSQREQALMRRVPVSRHLVEDLGDWLADHEGGPLFPDSKAVDDEGKPLPLRSYRNQTVYVTEAWKAATLAGEARREVWAPPSRKKTRPDHAFRAAQQGALDAAGFSESLRSPVAAIVDALVGHAPKSTRGRHYARPAET